MERTACEERPAAPTIAPVPADADADPDIDTDTDIGTDTSRSLGRIVRLQVQRASLKLPNADGAAHPQRFDPSPLVPVPRLLLQPQGVIGLLDDGSRIVDVHHTEHPASKNQRGINDVSVGFTAHYVIMRDQFGAHLTDGIAGENVLVETDARVEPDELSGGLAIETQDGTLAVLEAVVVAEPCVPFTRFCLRLAPAEPSGERVTDSLRTLRHGLRGYYANYAGAGADAGAGTDRGEGGGAASAAVVLRVGDRVRRLGS